MSEYLNKAQCLKCGDVIESKHRHDFRQCSCGEIFVDGGTEYQRAGANDFSNFRRITEMAPPITIEREQHHD